ncbi:uncharacterized protein LOC130695582 [Daphnia carinata]|uniref:uncharacterized protein LOC130695582 n=1 Tax=Daphnia carinata TaxID=120202 RepID=UPI0025807426|nr:uncharacterized protein LOC130695582 [Daphnia carinata]
MKLSILSLTVMAIFLASYCCIAVPAKSFKNDVVMENEQVLDPLGPMILRWTIINETSEIEIEVQTNCTGWMGVSFGNGLGFGRPGAQGDLMIGGYDDELGIGYIEDRWIDLSVLSEIQPGGGEFDDHIDVFLTSATYQEPWSIIRYRRSIDTGDSQDAVIRPGPMLVIWTYADSDNTSIPHHPDTPGSSQVTFINL